MGGKQVAVVVGVNSGGRNTRAPRLSYAEADAEAVFAMLTDPRTGVFDPADSVLLLGEQATTSAVKKALREAVVTARPSDQLLFYYAGHGQVPLVAPKDDPFLATADLDFDAVAGEPDRGLRMSFLRRDVFDVFPGSSCLILDCCHAGAYLDQDLDTVPSLQEVVQRLYSGTPRVESAIYACPAAAAARESKEVGHGLLTAEILAGLGGDAARPGREVTFADLFAYLSGRDLNPQPGFSTKGWSHDMVLARPAGPASIQPDSADRGYASFSIEPCSNPLDACAPALLDLLEDLFHRGRRRPPFTVEEPAAVLDWLRCALRAEGAARISAAGPRPEVVVTAGKIRREDALALAERLQEKIAAEGKGQSSVVGYIADPPSGGPRLLAVADSRRRPADVRVFSDVPLVLLGLGEPLPMVVAAAVSAAGQLSVDAEVEVITALHRRFGRLPVPLYSRCLTAYRNALATVLMVFEPVISLSPVPAILGIHSWEALARRSAQARTAPLGLLEAAEHWGDEFVVERDRTLATNAIAAYTKAHHESPWDVPKPLSLNVSVRSLLNEGYIDALDDALRGSGLGPTTITLEISERDAIEPHPGVDSEWGANPNEYFQDKLRTIARRLHVNFAIDDFGVGHASLDRVASLAVTQVKIDRSILGHPLAIDEIDLVVKLAQEGPLSGAVPNQRTVVVEGYDEECQIPLHQLYAHGVRFVQGYITKQPAAAELLPLSPELRDQIASLVRSPNANR